MDIKGLIIFLAKRHNNLASRPPCEIHGLFKTEEGCVVLEVSFPNKTNE